MFLKSSNFKNAYWSIADVVIYPIVLLVATPIFLKYLGAEQYGVWVLINSIIASIGVLNAGLGDATIKFISKYRATDNINGVKRVFTATYTLTCCVFFFTITTVLLSSEWITSSDLFKISRDTQPIANTALQLASVAFAFRLLEQIFFAFFKAYERFDIYSKISITSKNLALVAGVFLVIQGGSLVAIILCNTIAAILSVLIEVFLISKRLGFDVLIPRFVKADIKEVFAFSSWAWVQTAIGLIGAQLDRYIVAAAVSVEVLAYYSVGLLVASQIHNVFAAGSSFIFPLISMKIEKKMGIKHIYFKMQLLVIALGLLGITTLALLQTPLFTLWLGEANYAKSKEFITLFLCYEAAVLTSVIPYFYLIGAGLVRLNTFISGVGIAAMALCMMVLFYFIGETGLIWGKILSTVLITPFLYNILHRRVLEDADPFAGVKLLLPSFATIAFILVPTIPLKLLALLLCIVFFYKFIYKRIGSVQTTNAVTNP
ncbi:oligosaccharide flippase family protein [Pontibacter litorisediminis]|uniref:oligosaccharide flippase family protein n=1 Tax=Pontibacter litorisediminis TaxID=1846260 RepID=UPI0023EBEF2D|nr:oligosaccharide flippase family protein [Pontibacter litorisediminis]